MKKIFALMTAVLFAGSMMAEGLLFEQTYPGEPSSKVSSYSKSFTLTTNGYTLTYANINNGSSTDSWDAVRSGSKNGVSVATVTSAAIAEKVSAVVINFTQVSASNTNKLALLVADNANFTDATEIVATIMAGEVKFEVETPGENKFYRISIDQKQGSANGFNRWDKIQFISPDGGTPIVPVKYDTLTVAQAKELAAQLADNATSEEKYVVKGYAVYVAPYTKEYNNQIFFMVDDVNAPDSLFEAYAANPMKDKQVYPVLAGDKVCAFGALKKYKGDAGVQLEIVNPLVSFLEEVEGERVIEEIKYDTITTAEALAIAKALADPAEKGKTTYDTKTYVVGGYAVKVYDKNSDGSWSFGMCDEAGGYYEFQASNCTVTDKDMAQNDYMYVTGQIAKYRTQQDKIMYQIYKGTAVHGEAPAPAELDTITVAEALEIAKALTPEKTQTATTPKKYAVKAYVVRVVQKYENTYFLSDVQGELTEFEAFKCASEDRAVAEGDLVIVTGKISNYYGENENGEYHNYEIKGGDLVHADAQGIENVVLTEKAQKIMIDGVMYIIRDNKVYNLQGAQVR